MEIRRRIRKRGEKAEDYQESITQEQEVIRKEEQIEEESDSPDLITRATLRQDKGTFTTAKGINEISAAQNLPMIGVQHW